MSNINFIDMNTGDFVEIDVLNPTYTLHVVDANTGELVELDSSVAYSGILNVVDADTGHIVAIDYGNLSGNLHINDSNTGEIVTVDLATPSGTLYVTDANTGELVLIDLSTSKILPVGNFIGIPLVSTVDSTNYLTDSGSQLVLDSLGVQLV